MPVIGDQYVLRLEFPVDYPVAVQDPNSEDYLRYQLTDDLLAELYLFLLQVKIYVPLVHVLHYYIYFVLVLERLPYRH